MKVHVCTCKYCRAKKRGWSKNRRRRFSRMVSKARRRLSKGEIKNFYPC